MTVHDDMWEYMSRKDFNINWSEKLFHSCRALDGKFFDVLTAMPHNRGKKFFIIGSINPIAITSSGHERLKWLDKQSPDSIVYVLFG